MKFKDIDRVSILTLERGEPPHRAIWRKMHLSGSVDLLISMKPSVSLCVVYVLLRHVVVVFWLRVSPMGSVITVLGKCPASL